MVPGRSLSMPCQCLANPLSSMFEQVWVVSTTFTLSPSKVGQTSTNVWPNSGWFRQILSPTVVGRGRPGAPAMGASLPFRRPRLARGGGEGGARRCQAGLVRGAPAGQPSQVRPRPGGRLGGPAGARQGRAGAPSGGGCSVRVCDGGLRGHAGHGRGRAPAPPCGGGNGGTTLLWVSRNRPGRTDRGRAFRRVGLERYRAARLGPVKPGDGGSAASSVPTARAAWGRASVRPHGRCGGADRRALQCLQSQAGVAPALDADSEGSAMLDRSRHSR